jgi:alpha-galactosidase
MLKTGIIKYIPVLCALGLLFIGCKEYKGFKTNQVTIELVNSKNTLWNYKNSINEVTISIAPPKFEIDNRLITANLINIRQIETPVTLKNGTIQVSFQGTFKQDTSLLLQVTFKIPENNPVARFQYTVISNSIHKLTKTDNSDNLSYLSLDLGQYTNFKEIRFSTFDEKNHSFALNEVPFEKRYFENEIQLSGPMLIASNDKSSILIAYEHGSQIPDAFIDFQLKNNNSVTVKAVKGNYYIGQEIGPGRDFESIWFELATGPKEVEKLAGLYREFILRYMSIATESRKPYIFYNTWAYQERNKWLNRKQYLSSMNYNRISEEIEIAHKMGVEVYVIDAGWFNQTGDWQVNTKFFPDTLRDVSKKLRKYGMKLGLWFSPTQASVNSIIVSQHPEYRMSLNGKIDGPFEVWETPPSYNMCIESPYWEYFADQLIKLYHETGVSYFKWDAIYQYGCNDPGHFHGVAGNTPQERLDCYAFQMNNYLNKVVQKLLAECPQAIVDFDVTEGWRSMGIGFLHSGKYFAVNNGPYYSNYNIPIDKENDWSNIFTTPGPARPWVVRTPLSYDKWLPSVLFLSHYLPDDPESSQMINIGSLILGQNGIWGDLLSVSDSGITLFNKMLGLYKQVRDDITESNPVVTGCVSCNPEIHEKINEHNGRGAIVIFGNPAAGHKMYYVSKNKVDPAIWHNNDVSYEIDKQGRAVLTFEFKDEAPKIIFFGITGSI